MLPHLKPLLTDHVYSSMANERVVIKHAPEVRLRREMEILRQFEGDAYIGQLIDHVKDSPFLILEHLDSDALRLSRKALLSKQDIRLIARSMLSALGSLHAKGFAHTGNTVEFVRR